MDVSLLITTGTAREFADAAAVNVLVRMNVRTVRMVRTAGGRRAWTLTEDARGRERLGEFRRDLPQHVLELIEVGKRRDDAGSEADDEETVEQEERPHAVPELRRT
jgi:hypothetical protein